MSEQAVQSERSFRLPPSKGRPSVAELLHDEVIQRLFAAGVGLTALAMSPECQQVRDPILMHVAQIDDALQAAYRISAL